MGLSVIEGGLRDAREQEQQLARRLAAIAQQLADDITEAQRIHSHEPSTITTRQELMTEAAVRAQKRLDHALGVKQPYLVDADRARLKEVQAVVQNLATNLGLYLD